MASPSFTSITIETQIQLSILIKDNHLLLEAPVLRHQGSRHLCSLALCNRHSSDHTENTSSCDLWPCATCISLFLLPNTTA